MGTIHKHRALFVLLALLASCLVGCKSRHFKVVMSRNERGDVTREIVVSLNTGSYYESNLAKDSMVARITGIYGSPVSTNPDSNSRTYRKTFSAKLPQEIEQCGFTNCASVSSSESPLGRCILYTERMPGPTQWSEINNLFIKAVDLHIRALVAGLERDPELKSRPEELTRLTGFIRTRFRTDIIDCAFEAWLSFVQADAMRQSEGADENEASLMGTTAYRVAQLLVERGYFSNCSEVSLDDSRKLTRAVVDRFVREMGSSTLMQRPRVFTEWIEDENASTKFIEAGFVATGESVKEIEGAMDMLFPTGWGDSMSGTVAWSAKYAPVASNGKWDEAAHQLTWDCDINHGPIPSRLLWADWSEPDEKFQSRHLGRVLVRNKLRSYNQWYLALDPAMKKEWDRFILSLPGDNSLARQLKAFEFTGRPRDRKIPPENIVSVSDPYGGVGMILNAMKDPPPAPPYNLLAADG